jgi:UDP-galactopyranose mutase
MKRYDYVVVGAGFAGAVIAERIAAIHKKNVLVIDKRNHVGGNAYDYYDKYGVLVHKYGPHIFHTNNKIVFEYLSHFTNWRKYEHKVYARFNKDLYPMPINSTTIGKYYNREFRSKSELIEFLRDIKTDIFPVLNSKDIVTNQIGIDLYKNFFEKFTEKTWFKNPLFLKPGVCGRLKLRLNNDDRYFTDKYQFMPRDGYTELFKNILSNERIEILLNTDYKNVIKNLGYQKLIYTGPIDYYFDYCYGKLPYRSLKLKFKNIKKEYYQDFSVINFVGDEKKTRIAEFKHITGQKCATTTIGIEYPLEKGDEFYPTLTNESELLYGKYKKLAAKSSNVIFTGRLANFKYFNMDQVVAQSLNKFKHLAR